MTVLGKGIDKTTSMSFGKFTTQMYSIDYCI
jgi:hypothetical protein